MAASITLKAGSILAACGMIAIAYVSAPAISADGRYASIVKVVAGTLVILGALSLSSVIGRTLLNHRGRPAFKILYFASLSSTGVGVVVSASAFTSMNVNAALCVLSLVFAVAGITMFRFFQAADA